jgi:hypothetical protein
MNDPPTTEDFKSSLLVCDDIDAYSNIKTVMEIMNLIN